MCYAINLPVRSANFWQKALRACGAPKIDRRIFARAQPKSEMDPFIITRLYSYAAAAHIREKVRRI